MDCNKKERKQPLLILLGNLFSAFHPTQWEQLEFGCLAQGHFDPGHAGAAGARTLRFPARPLYSVCNVSQTFIYGYVLLLESPRTYFLFSSSSSHVVSSHFSRPPLTVLSDFSPLCHLFLFPDANFPLFSLSPSCLTSTFLGFAGAA